MNGYKISYLCGPGHGEREGQQFTVDPPNPELAQLNNDGTLPTNVEYTILYSTYTNHTQITKTGLFFNYAPGDTVVPEFSQLARLYDPNNPSDNCAWSPEECPWVPAFVGVDGSVSECSVNEPHHGYFNQLDVQSVLLQRLLGGTCSEYSRNAISIDQGPLGKEPPVTTPETEQTDAASLR